MSEKSERNTKLAIVGITGRMGTEIRALAPENGFEVTSGVAASGGDDLVDIQVSPKIDGLNAADVDILVDFSLPEAMDATIQWCVKHRKPLVSGVTGITTAQKALLEKAGQAIPVLWAPNMSLGVAVMARLLERLSSLEGFDFQLEELHHNRKKDKPSGTALFLQSRLEEAVSGVAKSLPEPLAIRGGGIFGIHRVWAMGEEEMITIEHTAMNRRVFARGALRAAKWIFKKAPGLYSMDDVLGA